VLDHILPTVHATASARHARGWSPRPAPAGRCGRWGSAAGDGGSGWREEKEGSKGRASDKQSSNVAHRSGLSTTTVKMGWRNGDSLMAMALQWTIVADVKSYSSRKVRRRWGARSIARKSLRGITHRRGAVAVMFGSKTGKGAVLRWPRSDKRTRAKVEVLHELWREEYGRLKGGIGDHQSF
jgi:hypothetical protein